MPPDVKAKILKSLRLSSDPLRTRFISLTTNRPNLCFAIKKIPRPLSDVSNFDFLLPGLYHPPMVAFKKTLIFVPSKTIAMAVEERLAKRLPGAVKRIYSLMSDSYKKRWTADFLKPDGEVSILIATTLLSNVRLLVFFTYLLTNSLQGFDPPDIDLVIIYGAPKNMLEFEQMAGRGGRDGKTNCLVLFLAEPWLYIKEEEREEGLTNPNGSKMAKASITDNEVFDFVQSSDCLRRHLAQLNEDTSDTGKLNNYIK